ncbi:MAG: ABC transporter ATP-binding protein [Dehalococcoidales bacterium]|jgi:ABC-type lipoprotein export system ATPase subunit
MNSNEAVKQAEGNIIEIKGLEKHFRSGGNDVKAVDGVTIGFPRAKMIALRGSSGSGKTTLLNLIGALDRPTSGSIIVDGVDVSKAHGNAEVKYRLQKVGFVFQAYCLIPNLSALENAMMPIELLNPKDKERVAKAQKLLERVGIDQTRQVRRPAKLSGGEQQRVAIARALANDPPIILADEPTGNLDSKNGKRIVELLRSLTKDGKTVLIATHDADVAASADIKIEMVDGKIVSTS